MSDVLGLQNGGLAPEWSHVVVVGWSDQRFGIIVDEFLGQREIVIKSLGDLLETSLPLAVQRSWAMGESFSFWMLVSS